MTMSDNFLSSSLDPFPEIIVDDFGKQYIIKCWSSHVVYVIGGSVDNEHRMLIHPLLLSTIIELKNGC
jgi:hypothetical protein